MNFLIIILGAIFLSNSPLQSGDNILLNSSVMQTENKWRIVNDDVMGGLSSSKAVIKDDKIIFSGNLSLENNGGFASLRSPVKDYDFSKFKGLEIRLKTDGKRYSILMKETANFSGYFYTNTFDTKTDEWSIVQIPFDQFIHNFFGQEINSGKKIPLDKIKEISLLIGDKQSGEFKAEIDYIMLY